VWENELEKDHGRMKGGHLGASKTSSTLGAGHYFKEDKNWTRTERATGNPVLRRKITLNLVHRNGTGKRSIRRHWNKAMTNDQ
jgi:hypothetical protein